MSPDHRDRNTTPDAPTPDAAAVARAQRKLQRRGRARDRNAFLTERTGEFDQHALDEAMSRKLEAEPDRPVRKRRAVAKAAPGVDLNRWVPIGPSVVRRGQAEGRPRVTGRVRDLAVNATGTRAYAASAKGGVWYTEDAGSTWGPVGAWAERSRSTGGSINAQVCGCLLVDFGATAANDYVMVGTGELVPWLTPASWSRQGGIGVLAGRGPAVAAAVQPWEDEAGIARLEGLGIFRLARHPASTAGSASGAAADRVLAGTSAGLFLGTRSTLPGPSATDAWSWAAVAGLDAFVGFAGSQVTDILWLAGGANGRIFVAIDSQGVAFSDNLGAAWTWVLGLDPTLLAVPIGGRMSFGQATAARFYVLGELSQAGPPAVNTPSLWQIPNASAAAPSATVVPGVPANLWGAQRDYDQAIAVDVVGAVERIYIGGSTTQPAAGGAWAASLWCFDTAVPPAALAASATISATAAPPAGAGADQAGLIGNNVHADVHVIRLTGAAGANRQVWVGCDGGVFVSAQAGRVNSFLARVTGLAALEVGFHANHPTSNHFVAIGCQDNGTQVRVGDTVWEETLQGDGGGVAFHPRRSQFLIAQYLRATWLGRPSTGYVDPLHRAAGGQYEGTPADREHGLSAFYSGAATIPLSASAGRLAIGTNRVWLSDNVGAAGGNQWRVIPVVAGAAVDARPGGADPVAQQGRGVPAGALRGVINLRWVTSRDLLALYQRGLVRYTQNAATNAWTATTLIPGTAGAPVLSAATILTDVFPVPGSSDFYLTTTGDIAAPATETCFFYDAATNTFTPTALRRALDLPGPPVVQGPLDPAYAIVVDPATPTNVYVGTVTGVWLGVRTPGTAPHVWTPFVNGLPQATVQDLSLWVDPAGAAGTPRLLRAAIQSRGMWEVNLAAAEPRRTYVRVHPFDDRRVFPTALLNPRKRPTAAPERSFASPDIVIRPAANRAAAPTWQLPGSTTINAANVPAYQLWTFQTAFRWIYPSIAADGAWSDQLGDLIQHHRNLLGLPAGTGAHAGRRIDSALWNAVVGGTRLTAAGAVSAAPADPLAVYRAPWQSAAAMAAVATEVDLMELVIPTRVVGGVWRVYREPSTVDVLVHHRDTRPLAPNDAFAILLWRSGAASAPLLATNPAAIPAFAASLLTAAPNPTPAGWNLVTVGGNSVHRLPVAMDARLPRAIPIDVDLSGVTSGHHVLLLAMVGSIIDSMSAPMVGAAANLTAFVRAWPYCAMRLLRVGPRPA